MRSSKKKNKLTDLDREQMRRDAGSSKRRKDFRALKDLATKMSFDQYLSWLTEMNALFPSKPTTTAKRKKFVNYKNALI